MNPVNFTVKAGCDNKWEVQLNGPNGSPAVFASGDTIVADVFPGDGQPALFSLAGTWTNAPGGTLTLQCPAAATVGLEGEFAVELTIHTLNPTAAINGLPGGATLTVEIASGVDATLTVYGTYKQLREMCPWVAECFDPQIHLAGFLRERARARATFDQIILRSYRTAAVGMFASLYVGAVSWMGNGVRRSFSPNTIIEGYLNANYLMLRDDVQRIVTWLAAAEIGRQRVGYNNLMAAHGSACERWAEAAITNCTADLDLNADGIPEISVPLGTSNTFFT